MFLREDSGGGGGGPRGAANCPYPQYGADGSLGTDGSISCVGDEEGYRVPLQVERMGGGSRGCRRHRFVRMRGRSDRLVPRSLRSVEQNESILSTAIFREPDI